MQPDPAEVREWLRKADTDLRVIRRLLTPDCAEWEAVGFHSQQAIEKALKGFLIARGHVPRRVHDLGYLMALAAGEDPRFAPMQRQVEPVSNFAVEFRYPGSRAIEPDEVRQAARIAADLVAMVRDLLA